ncbi:HAD family hydrolase [Dactylosporangium cerinum]|uniref:phosphoserine phosphatase n=1 Tax=Dactylosporangium cerinum TaxID=1434730 RepID=A0ABV9VPI0_9ACTN
MTADAPPAPRLALLDVDGTLTTVRSIWQYLLEHHGRWAGEGERNLHRFQSGELTYQEFCDLDAQLLAGMSYAGLCEIAATVPLRPGVTELFERLREREYRIVLISTGLRVLTRRFEQEFRVDWCVANDLATVDGLCTGVALIEVDEHEKGPHAKLARERFGAAHVVAIGDSAGDLPMFGEADLSIAVGCATPAVLAAVDVHLDDDLTAACRWL